MDAELCGMQGGVHENVTDREGGETGEKGAECPSVPAGRVFAIDAAAFEKRSRPGTV